MPGTGRPIAVWWIDQDDLYIRFEHITDKDLFDQVLRKFKSRVSSSGKWQPEVRAWKLRKSDMQRIAILAYELFGDDSLQPADSQFVQPRLF